MTTTRTVRVTRTWDVSVDAEYGDDYWSLCEKVTEYQLDTFPPDADSRVVLEEHESPVDKWYQRDDNEALGELYKAANRERAGFLTRVRDWAAAVTPETVEEKA